MKQKIYSYLRQNWLLSLILLLGAVLRIIGLGGKSIWYDEACSVDFCQNSWGEIFSHRYMLRPLYFIILKLWAGFFGYKEFFLRIPSVFFAVCSILLVYFLAKKLFDKKTGLLTAFFLAVSPYHIIRSQDARGYTLLMLLVCAAAIIFWDIIKNKKQSYLAYSIIMILMFLTNFFAAGIVFIFHNLFFLFGQKKYKRWLLFQLLVLITAAAIILPFAKHYYLEQYNDQFSQPEYNNVLLNTFEDFSYARKINQGGVGNYAVSEIALSRKLNYYLILSLFFCTLLRYLLGKRGEQKVISRKTVFLLFWIFFPLTVFLFTNLFIPISKWSKSAIIILPAFYMLISLSLSRLSKKAVIVFLGLYVVFTIYSLNFIYSVSRISSWKQVAANVQENVKDKEMILFAPAHLVAPFWYYYKYEDKSAFRQIGNGDCGQFALVYGRWQMEFKDKANLLKGLNFDQTSEMLESIDSLPNNYPGIWLITSSWFGEKNVKLIINKYAQYYELESSKQYPWQPVMLYHFTLKQ